MGASRPAAGAALTLLKALAPPGDPLAPGLRPLRVLDPAYPLVPGERRDGDPGRKRIRSRPQRGFEVCGCLVDDSAGQGFDAHQRLLRTSLPRRRLNSAARHHSRPTSSRRRPSVHTSRLTLNHGLPLVARVADRRPEYAAPPCPRVADEFRSAGGPRLPHMRRGYGGAGLRGGRWCRLDRDGEDDSEGGHNGFSARRTDSRHRWVVKIVRERHPSRLSSSGLARKMACRLGPTRPSRSEVPPSPVT